MNEYVLMVENLSKVYNLYDDPVDRLKESLHPLRKKYHRDFYALKDVSFYVKEGEIVGVIGKNGSGKSTLLKILTGVLTPSAGHVATKGKILALLELGTGFNPELSGIDNIYFNGALLGATREEMDSKIDAILDFADIGDFVFQPVKTYSSGMYVRLAFAVIANMDANVLIVDEALSVGDAFFVQKCMRFLREFMKTGTLIFVSHDIGAVLNLCSSAVWLHEGKIKLLGHPKQVTEAYLADLYESQQGTGEVASIEAQGFYEKQKQIEPRDSRLDFVNSTQFRNDIELFSFQDNGVSFGRGGASVTSVILVDENNSPLSWVIGGEMVSLIIHCIFRDNLSQPIIGFVVKDRLGQFVFGDNTYLTYANEPISYTSGQKIEAQFSFRMPVMPVGDYSVSVAIAEGTQKDHIQHQWLNDALVFKSHSSSVCKGILGIPMHKIMISLK